jgi:hypothetical protein
MRAFSRPTFQLRTASLETRIAYTGFLALTALGIGTLLALSLGRVGFDPSAVATYYRGGESEMSFPRTFWQLMEVSHFHLFSVPTVLLILSHLLFATPSSRPFRVSVTVLTYAGAVLEAAGPWAVRYIAAAFAYALILGWLLLAGGSMVMIAVTLWAMWGPERRAERLDSTSAGGEA